MSEPTVRSTTIKGRSLARVKINAEKCWLNGKSHVRSSESRSSFGVEDQIVGQLGELALARFLGKPETYFERRALINENPWQGDGGSDFPGLQVDVKTSLMRRVRSPLSYNLVVRPRERHEDNLYVFALVPSLGAWDCRVLLVGYATDADLPVHPESEGVFAGAHRLPARGLRDLGELAQRISA